MFRKEQGKKTDNHGINYRAAIAIGVGIGCGIGVAIGNLAIGIAVGIGAWAASTVLFKKSVNNS